ncbi:hypothetical protein R70723_31955 [Paenibacillus sp. FSL R7-0273]|uniref:class I SAM-dependent methyltransferase n=1 Tax=Paenibacillus sp. FSL R7-0273 TaxID=1536772 RepID=UPI0004F90FE9|nr:class I SAM-dependent methyltransferase [Paenibacillus sp. FSL R7-0273]AIQ49982.1 hypothetical protein R70723_31955 [Paenibacillus sp. FSL R7-0273]OMF90851.1 SAM-dependent methyltransferase [Paenibacillus sp. FSL R7-0273]
MPFIEIIPWIITFVLLLSVLWIVLISWKNGISPMPASGLVRLAVIAEVQRIRGYSNIVEAGSGWGTLGLEVIRHCPGKRLTGIENSGIPLGFSRLFTLLYARMLPEKGAGEGLRKRVIFKRGDIYSYSYRDADIVLCYLFPGAMALLAEKFRQQLPQGATVISICFALPDRQPVRVITCKDRLRTKVYVYRY